MAAVSGNRSAGMSRILVWWDVLRVALWPIPLSMSLAAIILYAAGLMVDATGIDELTLKKWRIYSGSGDDARNLLATLLGSIITMSSVVFSITIVALSLAANQFGSRLIRTHLTDVRTKLALGLFAMTIVYIILAMRSVEQEMPPSEVPHVTVSLGVLLALACVLVLLFFLHFIARSVVADEVIRRATAELEATIEDLPDLEPGAQQQSEAQLPADFDARCTVMRSPKEGYIEAIAYEDLATAASKHDVIVRLDLRPGAFICKDGWLAAVYPAETLTPRVEEDLCAQILIGERRTPTQDIEFSLRHLVDIALRALSPGINDANTALVVIEHLSAAMAHLMGKKLSVAVCRDDAGVVRVMGKADRHGGILDAALHQIRRAASTHPAVIMEMLRALGRIAENVRLPEQREALLRHCRLALDAGLRDQPEPADQADMEAAFMRARMKVEGRS